jgi:ribosomal protein S27E
MPETLTTRCPSCGGPQEVYEDPEDGSVEVYCPDCLCCVAAPEEE